MSASTSPSLDKLSSPKDFASTNPWMCLGRFVETPRQICGFWSYLICFITLKVNNLVILMASLSNFSYHGLFSRVYTIIRAITTAQPPQPPVVPGLSGVPPSIVILVAVDVNWSNESK